MHAYFDVGEMSAPNSNTPENCLVGEQANKRIKLDDARCALAEASILNIKSQRDFYITHAIMSGRIRQKNWIKMILQKSRLICLTALLYDFDNNCCSEFNILRDSTSSLSLTRAIWRLF